MSYAAMGEGIAAVDTQRRNVGDLRAGEAAQGGILAATCRDGGEKGAAGAGVGC